MDKKNGLKTVEKPNWSEKKMSSIMERQHVVQTTWPKFSLRRKKQGLEVNTSTYLKKIYIYTKYICTYIEKYILKNLH